MIYAPTTRTSRRVCKNPTPPQTKYNNKAFQVPEIRFGNGGLLFASRTFPEMSLAWPKSTLTGNFQKVSFQSFSDRLITIEKLHTRRRKAVVWSSLDRKQSVVFICCCNQNEINHYNKDKCGNYQVSSINIISNICFQSRRN